MRTSETRPVGELLPTGSTWKIGNFSNLKGGKYYSEVFVIGGCKWKLMADLRRVELGDFLLDLFLCIGDSPTQPGQWSVDAEFSFAVVDQKGMDCAKKSMRRSFTAQHYEFGTDGSQHFINSRTLRCLEKKYFVNDTCVVEVSISVQKVVGYMTYPDDSKEEATGDQGGAAAPSKLGSDRCQSTEEKKKNAYLVVLRFLCHEGELTWKKEALLTKLRDVLGISTSDHVMYLKHVLSG